MFAHFDCHRGNDRVQMIRRRHDNRVQRLFGFEHLAEIAIELGLRMFGPRARRSVFVHVANRHDIFAGAKVHIARAFAHHTNDTDIHLVIGGNLASISRDCRTRKCRCSSG
jgi:hypothetical protein